MALGLISLNEGDPLNLIFDPGAGGGPPDYTAADLLAQHEREIAWEDWKIQSAELQEAARARAAAGQPMQLPMLQLPGLKIPTIATASAAISGWWILIVLGALLLLKRK